MDRIQLDEAYMRMAETWAQRSYATRSKVGALLIKDQQIISDGYNGMPSGMPNEQIELPNADGTLSTNPLVIHAEANVFDKLSKFGDNRGAIGSTLYVTMSPCVECTKRIINNKVARVVYRTEYRIKDALDILRAAGVEVVHLPGGSAVMEHVHTAECSLPQANDKFRFIIEQIPMFMMGYITATCVAIYLMT